MQNNLVRCYFIELVGTCLLVFFAAGVVCVNHMTTPVSAGAETPTSIRADQTPPPLNPHQPGLVGTAMVQGLTLAILLAITVPLSGGFLNPAIALMLWVYNRLETKRLVWYVGAQFLGGFVAVMMLRGMFTADILRDAFYGSPHLNRIVFPTVGFGATAMGVVLEMVLTFLLVFAIFGITKIMPQRAIWGGIALTACVLLGFSLTGSAVNPARWLGPVIWEGIYAGGSRSPWEDMFVFVAGPILGALAAGFCVYYLLPDKSAANADA